MAAVAVDPPVPATAVVPDETGVVAEEMGAEDADTEALAAGVVLRPGILAALIVTPFWAQSCWANATASSGER